MTRTFERFATTMMAAIALLIGGMLTSMPAQAATVDAGVVVADADADAGSAAVNYCNTKSANIFLPIYVVSQTSTWQCYLNPSHDDYDATRALQLSYNECYSHLYPGDLPSGRTTLVTDGDYGGETLAAVENIQDRHGLGTDGLYGPATARVINTLIWDYSGCHTTDR